MHTINARNVNFALSEGLNYLLHSGLEEGSRNGAALVAPGPVVTVYSHPTERVMFSPLRNANPFFHLMEALWMLGGRNDIAWPVFFNSKFITYSDNGVTQHGAYGHRWRNWFLHDQLELLAKEITANPNTRRAVLAMWSPVGDLFPDLYGYHIDYVKDVAVNHKGGLKGVDIPCNTHAYFDARNGKLNMTVCCRSNDIWWGAYGANAVHFSLLQEYLAFDCGLQVGEYRQFSNNYHLYTNVVPKERLAEFAADADIHGHQYPGKHFPLIHPGNTIDSWREELSFFLDDPMGDQWYTEPFFARVAAPMYHAWYARKVEKDNGAALNAASCIKAADWRKACTEWLLRNTKQVPK